MREEYKLTEADRNASFIFLLDAFNEIPTTAMQIRCIRDIQIHNERYRLTKKDVRSNLERCLDMVKARFPDKEPLIQKMIRSIR